MIAKPLVKYAFLPWHTRLLRPPEEASRLYFGPPTKSYGGPDLKIRKLKAFFGNHWLNHNVLYVVSGKPVPLAYVEMAKRRGCKIVLNQNGVYYPAWYKERDWKKKNAWLRRYHELADYVIYQSRFCRDCAIRFIDPPERPHEILYNAIDTDALPPLADKNAGSTINLVSVNFFSSSKSYAVEALVKTVGLMKERHLSCRLLLAGRIQAPTSSTNGVSWLSQLAASRGVDTCVQYAGAYDNKRLSSIFPPGAIFLHMIYNDASPSVVLEALSSGLPVVFSQSGGTPELVGDAGVGLPVPQSFETCHTPESEAIMKGILSVAGQYESLRQRARERALRHFAITDWLNRHETIFRDVLN